MMSTFDWYTDDEKDEELGYWHPIKAYDMEDAAQKAAGLWDQDDHILLRYNSVVFITVVNRETGETGRFKVYGETVPHYHAYEVKGETYG